VTSSARFGVLLLLALFALGATRFRGAAEAHRPNASRADSIVIARRAQNLRQLTFGFAPLVADAYFLRAIQLHGQRPGKTTAAAWSDGDRALAELLDRATDIDPLFADAYRFTGNALPRETTDGKVTGALSAARILGKGVEARLPDWRIPFQLGFIESYYLGDPARAASALTVAARLGAPPYVGLLATRLAVIANDLALAEAIARELAAQPGADAAAWRERLADLRMERDLHELERALAAFVRREGAPPDSLDALVPAGDLPTVPPEPHGGLYLLGPDGKVSSSAAPRLDAHRASAWSGLRAQ
jgi:hypothetical protein